MIEIKDQAIDNEIAKRQIDADVQYSVVHISLSQNTQVRKEMIPNDSIEDYGLPFSKNMGNALAGGWQMFLTFFIALAHLWAFIVAAILIWIGVRYYRLKKGGSIRRNLLRNT